MPVSRVTRCVPSHTTARGLLRAARSVAPFPAATIGLTRFCLAAQLLVVGLILLVAFG
jgi:hypothetical protein